MSRMYSGVGVALVVLLAACGGYVKKDAYNEQIAGIQAQLDSHDSAIKANTASIELAQADIAELEGRLDALAEELQARIEEMENGIRFAMPVHFNFDEADIRLVDEPALDRFAGVVSEYYPGVVVTVEGFADPAGSAEYNKWLSEQRAQNVATYLLGNSTLDATAVKTVGYGEERQVRPGAWGPDGLDNRRVTFVIEYAMSGEATEMSATAN